MAIDAHQHFWIYNPVDYPWILDSMRVLRRDFLPPDLVREQARAHVQGSVVVQARQTLTETRWLLELADQHSVIRGVVGWVDLRSDSVAVDLTEFGRHPKFVGVRHVVQEEPDIRFLMQPEFVRGLERLEEFDLAYDLLLYPKQLPAAIELARRLPRQRFVLDHIAKPLIRAGVIGPWAEYIRELGQCANVYCKISGMVTEADWSRWSKDDFSPYLGIVWDAFGEDRLMIGSDWPVCLLAGTYAQIIDIPRHYFKDRPEMTRNKIFELNARRFYRI